MSLLLRTVALVRHFLLKWSHYVDLTGQIHSKEQKKGGLLNCGHIGKKDKVTNQPIPQGYHLGLEEKLRLK